MKSYAIDNKLSILNVPTPSTAHPQLEAAALEHLGLLHPDTSAGRVSIPHIDDAGRWREGRTYSLDKLPDLIPTIAGQRDTYISQHRFTARREIAQLWQLGAMYVDIDFHKVPELAGMDPRGVLDDCLIALERARKPWPTLAIFSGRGLYLVWLHRGVPRKVAPRWNACQRELWRVLRPFGADRGALDAARVLRLSGTVNSKSGAAVERIAPVGDVWDFEDLASEVLPMEREEVAEIRDIRAARATKRPSERLIVPNKVFTAGTLWAGRLGDLQRLLDFRFLDRKLPPHQRDHWMLIAGVAMSWVCVAPALQRELTALARQVGGWSEREAGSRLQAVTKRAHMAARGEMIEWRGQMVDARYHYKNSTIIDLLEITPDEEEVMDVLISSDEARRRHRRGEEKRRREAGAVTRAEYREGSEQRRTRAAELRARGLKQREIADALGCTQQEVSRLLKGIDKAIQQSVWLYGGEASPEGGQEGRSRVPQSAVVEEDARESKKSSSPQSERSDSPAVTPPPLSTSEPDPEAADDKIPNDDYQSMLSRATARMVLSDDADDDNEIVYREVVG